MAGGGAGVQCICRMSGDQHYSLEDHGETVLAALACMAGAQPPEKRLAAEACCGPVVESAGEILIDEFMIGTDFHRPPAPPLTPQSLGSETSSCMLPGSDAGMRITPTGADLATDLGYAVSEEDEEQPAASPVQRSRHWLAMMKSPPGPPGDPALREKLRQNAMLEHLMARPMRRMRSATC